MTSSERGPTTRWTALVPLAELRRRGGRMVVRSGAHRIALYDTPVGLRACANRCPHEGYPLVAGSVAVHDDGRCVLTCNWHNWKFDLASGDNLMQGEGARVYALRVRGGLIEADLVEADGASRRQQVLAGLRRASEEYDYPRIAREQARWLRAGGDPVEPLRDAIRRSHDRLRWGWTHAYAASADWLRLHDSSTRDAEARLACLTEALAHIAHDTLREPRYAYTRRRRRWHEGRFLAAIEAEDEATAIAVLRGALNDDGGSAVVRPALTRAALAHYNDFGHSLIYAGKAVALIDRLGESVAEPLLVALVRGLVNATREDLTPDFRDYAPALARFGASARGAGAALPGPSELRGLGVRACLRRVSACVAPPEAIFRRLLAANAEAMLSFDTSHERRTRGAVNDNVGWLDFTHALTFANAARQQCSRLPDLWPAALLQMACFLGRNQRYRAGRAPMTRWRVVDETGFWRDAERAVLDHGLDDVIASAHRLKTMLAVRQESLALPAGRHRNLLLAALNRFLHEPLERRHVRRTAHQALRFAALES